MTRPDRSCALCSRRRVLPVGDRSIMARKEASERMYVFKKRIRPSSTTRLLDILEIESDDNNEGKELDGRSK